MTVPRTVDVGPIRYSVKVEHIDGQLGECNPDTATIRLSPQPDTVGRESLLHECLHAVTEMVGVADELGEKGDEALVRRLAPALLDLLRRNPRLVAHLTAT